MEKRKCEVCGKEFTEGVSLASGDDFKFETCSLECFTKACKARKGALVKGFTEIYQNKCLKSR
jgi:hypothetical protein